MLVSTDASHMNGWCQDQKSASVDSTEIGASGSVPSMSLQLQLPAHLSLREQARCGKAVRSQATILYYEEFLTIDVLAMGFALSIILGSDDPIGTSNAQFVLAGTP